MALTSRYSAYSPSTGRGTAFKDWSERSKHRTGTMRKHDQVIHDPNTARAFYLSNVTRIHTSKIDGKVYGKAGKQTVRRMRDDVWETVRKVG